MPNVVLVTGVSHHLGGRLAAHLAADPSIERIIGADTVAPSAAELARLGRTEFVRADIRNPLIAKVIAQARVDTVVHAAVLASPRAVGRIPMKEMNVIGTMQLLAACQKSDTIRRLVVKSTTAIYGCGPADPAVFTEDMQPRGSTRSGYAQDAVEVESYVRGFARRRPDVTVSVLRLASVVGQHSSSPFARYLAMPVLPTSLGFDPRMQLLHESDAVEALRLATVTDRPGAVNVAADGVMSLSQAIRRTGALRVPVPAPALAAVGTLVRNSGVSEFAAEQARFLNYGRVVDTTRLHRVFGYHPRLTTLEALAAHVAARGGPRAGRLLLGAVQRVLTARDSTAGLGPRPALGEGS